MTEQPGQGIAGTVQGRPVRVGRAGWAGVTGEPPWVRTVRRRARLDSALTLFVAADGEPAGAILLEDRIRPDARATIRAIRRGGITRIVLATGDRAEAAEAVGALTGVDEVLAGLTPEDKLDAVRRERRRAPVIMTGDGINDAPALALADVGIAMGARGSTASSEAADAVLTVDQLGRLGDVAALARRTRRIAQQSVLAGMGLSLAAMGAAARPAARGVGRAVWGALLQEAIDVAVILNALRALRPPAPAVRVTAAHTALTTRFRTEHQAIRADIEQLRIAADTQDTPGVMTRVRQVYATLTGEVLAHERAEEAELYPSLNQVLGGADPTAPMSRAHAEIAYQIARLGRAHRGHRRPGAGPLRDRRSPRCPARAACHPRSAHRTGRQDLPLARRRRRRPVPLAAGWRAWPRAIAATGGRYVGRQFEHGHEGRARDRCRSVPVSARSPADRGPRPCHDRQARRDPQPVVGRRDVSRRARPGDHDCGRRRRAHRCSATVRRHRRPRR